MHVFSPEEFRHGCFEEVVSWRLALGFVQIPQLVVLMASVNSGEIWEMCLTLCRGFLCLHKVQWDASFVTPWGRRNY